MTIYMNSTTSDIPLVCNMDVFTPAEREDHIQATNQSISQCKVFMQWKTAMNLLSPMNQRRLWGWENLFQTSGYAVHSWSLR